MPTVLRRDGFEFVIRTHDYTPAHTHVFKSGEAEINLGYDVLPSIRKVKGMSKNDVGKALDITIEEQSYLLMRWCEYHSDIDEWCEDKGEDDSDEEN
jgi:hypothetical protein